MATYRLDRHWGIQAGAGYDRLVGDAAESPVVKDENQYRLSMGLSYTF
jgi:outer membrane protein